MNNPTYPLNVFDLAPALRAALGHRGWTQAELAERSGVSTSTLSRLLRAGWARDPEDLRRVLAALGLEIDGMLRLRRIGEDTLDAAVVPPPEGCDTPTSRRLAGRE
jgi:transcriptional regulator with XRE-family HTH domain